LVKRQNFLILRIYYMGNTHTTVGLYVLSFVGEGLDDGRIQHHHSGEGADGGRKEDGDDNLD
jgi:hypothetical protein